MWKKVGLTLAAWGAACILAIEAMAAVGTVTQTVQFLDNSPNGNKMIVVTLAVVASSSDGTVPDTTISADLKGYYLWSIETDPGATAPNIYDVTVLTANSTDLLGGNGADRSATASQIAFPATGAGPVAGALTFTMTQDAAATNSATTTVVLTFAK